MIENNEIWSTSTIFGARMEVPARLSGPNNDPKKTSLYELNIESNLWRQLDSEKKPELSFGALYKFLMKNLFIFQFLSFI